ncbi:hypothetical protein [Brunnivagina elsteri]|uniref:hypothetical protein n=1 Tax=Brunnivagina elsteri TaxID=1247191 RepID=UPI001177861E|nr:hypothetical protein [Calothrix elsteri]
MCNTYMVSFAIAFDILDDGITSCDRTSGLLCSIVHPPPKRCFLKLRTRENGINPEPIPIIVTLFVLFKFRQMRSHSFRRNRTTLQP